MSYLCDTNIISELTRPMPNAGVTAWSDTVTSISDRITPTVGDRS
ncbi:MAG TPA: hypothetical protein VK203_19265 [Nostocaceae cyanobacterium]|nr:hypothetical protein [Nostocaceae cyanobacterium]